jgi:NAD+ synthase (glutamine-hydrolysing)
LRTKSLRTQFDFYHYKSYNRAMNFGYFRVAVCSPCLSVADCTFNAQKIIDSVKAADEKKVEFLVFPELSVTGYTCGDLFLQESLADSALKNLETICRQTKNCAVLFCVGLPVQLDSRRYNCAAFVFRGKILAVVPKTFVPDYSEFYEKRWFSSADKNEQKEIPLFCGDVPFGTEIFIQDEKNPLVKIAAEICEDLWVPLSPSTFHALNGATVVANLSASNEIVGKSEYRRNLVAFHSAKTVSAYIYANAGRTESTTDLVFSGHSLIALNGTVKKESLPFSSDGEILFCDVDLEKIKQDRLRATTFCENSPCRKDSVRIVKADFMRDEFSFSRKNEIFDEIPRFPFVPQKKEFQAERCKNVVELQSEGLAKRFRHIGAKSAVVGLSGGLDSTLALLVCVRAADKCGLDRKRIFSVTMPAFGTTGRTYKNACSLAAETGTTLMEIDIKKSVLQHFADIGHDESVRDVTYENAQARERTQILMDVANKNGGIVIGTGDLSELALGWCTYNADQMSMYGVNSSIPKTLVKHLVSHFADEAENSGEKKLADVLRDILDTPVSPELLPPDNGTISQKTEEIVGPYELHDFFLYYVLRWGFSAKKIFFLANHAFCSGENPYPRKVVFKWLESFYRRFFSQQFKRNCMPDGAKVGTVNLSPRGDWRMPSDASPGIWLNELDEIRAKIDEFDEKISGIRGEKKC